MPTPATKADAPAATIEKKDIKPASVSAAAVKADVPASAEKKESKPAPTPPPAVNAEASSAAAKKESKPADITAAADKKESKETKPAAVKSDTPKEAMPAPATAVAEKKESKSAPPPTAPPSSAAPTATTAATSNPVMDSFSNMSDGQQRIAALTGGAVLAASAWAVADRSSNEEKEQTKTEARQAAASAPPSTTKSEVPAAPAKAPAATKTEIPPAPAKAPAKTAAAPAPATKTEVPAAPVNMPAVSAKAETTKEDEPEFTAGQRVTILAPPAMLGRQGTIVEPVPGSEAFAVRLDSGSVFNILTQNLQDSEATVPTAAAAAPSPAASAVAAAPAPAASAPAATAPKAATSGKQDSEDEELEFAIGQQVKLLGPPAMVGKLGTVLGVAPNNAFAVRLESGSVFNIVTESLQDASESAAASAPVVSAPPAVAKTAPAPVAQATIPPATEAQDEEAEFTPGQRVTLLGPPALKGKGGTIVRPGPAETFAVQLDSGSIFNIATEHIQDAALTAPEPAPAPAPVPAPAASVPPAPSPAASVVAEQSSDTEFEFEKGQVVEILAPPALAGKQGTIDGPGLDDSWMVVLQSGSIFQLKTSNLKLAAKAGVNS
eukprot:TRINITY_DN3650_c0_g1_i12.p1 TRINITY_DN3650_c0_g1~~TRINITY_DN3650_c0_g1_i12.p1  ORF type:complete len:607 (-),score=175.86 TRINITY_DN3650_c0_g1_i12:151-1971(-)